MNEIKKFRVYYIFYFFAVFAVLAVFIFSVTKLSDNNVALNDFNDNWYSDQALTKQVNINNPQKNEGYKFDETQNYYAKLPDEILSGECLWFQIKNSSAEVFIDDGSGFQKITEVDKGNWFFGKSRGTVWCSVPLCEKDSGGLVKIEYKAAYNDSSCSINQIHLGNEKDIISEVLRSKIVSVVVCGILMFIGLILIAIALILKHMLKIVQNELIFVGFFAIATSTWSLCELKVLQVFTNSTGALHVLAYMGLMFIPIPLFLYLANSVADKKHYWIVHVICILSVINISLTAVLHYGNILDYHETLTFTHVVLGLSILGVFYLNLSKFFNNKKNEKKNFVMNIGVVIFAFSAAVDLVRYKLTAVTDSTFFTRIGFLIYILTIAAGSLKYTAMIIKKGLKADIISHLAYEDGLTGLGNRTAYMEKLDDLENGGDSTIFVFDINNLKYVNDNLGHSSGDNLIKYSAKVIKDVFENYGDCYRIGGDEFVCLAEGNVDIDLMLSNFEKKLQEMNKNETAEYEISVAAGASYYRKGENLKKVIEAADYKMYENKKHFKAQYGKVLERC